MPPVARTALGSLEGSVDARGVARFAGVAYATPPARFAEAAPVEAWSGVRAATAFGAAW